jgi:cytochrome oxidase Cu insertion factor (SCO1/SenC/PrrC family)
VLAKHAAVLQADPAIWRFATGPRETVRRFGAQFGVSTPDGAPGPAEIVHNLRTAVIDREGRLAVVLNGSEWTPADLIEALRKAY